MRKYLLIAAIILSTTQAHAVTRGLILASTGPGDQVQVPDLPRVTPPELPKLPRDIANFCRTPNPVIVQYG